MFLIPIRPGRPHGRIDAGGPNAPDRQTPDMDPKMTSRDPRHRIYEAMSRSDRWPQRQPCRCECRDVGRRPRTPSVLECLRGEHPPPASHTVPGSKGVAVEGTSRGRQPASTPHHDLLSTYLVAPSTTCTIVILAAAPLVPAWALLRRSAIIHCSPSQSSLTLETKCGCPPIMAIGTVHQSSSMPA